MLVSASLLAASAAVRVASLNMCTDEYLLLLARPEEVASVSRLSRDPADSTLWRVARPFPKNRGDLESALPSRPTLVLTMGGGGRATALIARRMGMRTLDLPFPASIEDVEASMVKVAAALGDARRAAQWRKKLRALGGTHGAPADAIFLGAGGNSIGATSLEAQWMRLAGFRQRQLPGSRASLELLATRPPAVLLRSSYRQGERSIGQSWLDHPIARPKRSRVITIDGRPWTCAGPLMVDEIQRFRTKR